MGFAFKWNPTLLGLWDLIGLDTCKLDHVAMTARIKWEVCSRTMVSSNASHNHEIHLEY